LRRCRAHPHEQITREWNAQRCAKSLREFERLVVTALAKARAMQRHGDEHDGSSRLIDMRALDHQLGEHAARSEIVAELETRFEQIERVRISEWNPGRSERRRALHALAA